MRLFFGGSGDGDSILGGSVSEWYPSGKESRGGIMRLGFGRGSRMPDGLSGVEGVGLVFSEASGSSPSSFCRSQAASLDSE